MTSGSLEYIVNGASLGIPVDDFDPEAVDALAAVLWGVTDLVATDPAPDGMHGEWTGTDRDGRDVILRYWLPTPTDPISIARAMLAAAEAG